MLKRLLLAALIVLSPITYSAMAAGSGVPPSRVSVGEVVSATSICRADAHSAILTIARISGGKGISEAFSRLEARGLCVSLDAPVDFKVVSVEPPVVIGSIAVYGIGLGNGYYTIDVVPLVGA